MLANVIFLLSFVASVAIGFVYFRDLGDVVQVVLKVKRENMIRFIRHERTLVMTGLSLYGLATVAHFGFGGGPFGLWLVGLILVAILYGFPYVWVHLGLRNQQAQARYFSIDEALKVITPSSTVVVIENGGRARAHPDSQIMYPHLAGDEKGLAGEPVVMTYCAIANLGIGYRTEIEGKELKLEVLAQHGNNLILRDEATGEPIQHIYGFREGDTDPSADGPTCPLRPELAMQPWPTFRMTMRGFQRAYPEGEVFLNKPATNPLLRLLDFATSIAFGWGIARQHQEAAPVMDNMTRRDDRLHTKTYVWGINIGNDAACWTDDFIQLHDGPVNARVGGRDIVLAWHQPYESIGAWYNDSGAPVTEIDFFGQSDKGQLKRVENLKSGLFWHVWAEFFPHTDINRVGPGTEVEEDKVA